MTDKLTNTPITDYNFDIVVPIGPNETQGFDIKIHHIKNLVCGYRNIYIVCYIPNVELEGCITVNEDVFPFTKDKIKYYFSEFYGKRAGWYLQQLIKFYAGECIPGILDKYLVIDADILLLKPLRVFQDNKFLFNYSTIEFHEPYFSHMKRLHSSLTRQTPYSGITHHMIFYKPFIQHLFQLVEELRRGKPFWKIFIECVCESEGASGASEYEIYFNFVLKYYPEHIMLRPLHWDNIQNYDYVSICNWMGRPV